MSIKFTTPSSPDIYRVSDGIILFSIGVIMALIGFAMVELFAILESTYTSIEIESVVFLKGYGFILAVFGVLLIIFSGIVIGYGYGTSVSE